MFFLDTSINVIHALSSIQHPVSSIQYYCQATDNSPGNNIGYGIVAAINEEKSLATFFQINN